MKNPNRAKVPKHSLGPEISTFLIQSRMSEHRFGILVSNSTGLVREIRNGRLVGDRLAKRIREFMKGYES